MSSPKQLARIAGVFYLLVGIFGGFAEGFVDPKLYVAGNAGATAARPAAGTRRRGRMKRPCQGILIGQPSRKGSWNSHAQLPDTRREA
jgi:hypothetical protein